MDRDYLRALPPLRFVVALFLVLFHLNAYGYMSVEQPLFQRLVSKGYVGTSLFFVISGFVMTHLYGRSTGLTPATFYWKRLTRVLPPYYLGLLLSVPVLLFGAAADPQPAVFVGQLALYLSTLQAWVYGQAFVFNAPGWSVSVLVLFYLLFPLLRSRILALPVSAVLRVSGLLWLAYMVPPLVYLLVTHGRLIAVDDDSLPLNFLKTFPLFRLPELVLGMLTAALYQRLHWEKIFSRAGMVWGCFGLLVGIMLLVPEPNRLYPLLHNGLLTPLLMATVLSVAYHRGALARLGESLWMQRLGNASLNIFLLHVPLFAYYGRLLRGDRSHWTSPQVLGYLILLTGLSLAVEALVMVPLLRRFRTQNWLLRFAREPEPVPVLALAAHSPPRPQTNHREPL